MVGQGSQAAQMPNISRLVEAVGVQLSRIHPEGTTVSGVRVNRWAAVMRDYICIQENILTNPVLMAQTRIQLFPLNQRTLAQWHYARTRELVRRALEMAVPLPTSSALASEPTPAVRPRPTGPEQSAAQPLEFHNPPDLSGQATQRRRGPVDVAPAIIGQTHMKHPSPSHSPRRLTLPLLRFHRRRQDPQKKILKMFVLQISDLNELLKLVAVLQLEGLHFPAAPKGITFIGCQKREQGLLRTRKASGKLEKGLAKQQGD
ncbi:uncharacterized protein LOC114657618 [Erpetoichthys calabaricus]|uniref:uncharacterized protein LOC114657618 n=1 Tax=Erpetoichthys calabaricus TaxID=27687 RepID=UPI002234C5DE|nr:uncharacterized protein LOC114657618 [Erpetoichthys calabaricus]